MRAIRRGIGTSGAALALLGALSACGGGNFRPVSDMPVRIGIPQHVTGLGEVVGNPVHATGVGLLLMGSQIENPRRPTIAAGRAGSFLSKLKNWYRGEF